MKLVDLLENIDDDSSETHINVRKLNLHERIKYYRQLEQIYNHRIDKCRSWFYRSVEYSLNPTKENSKLHTLYSSNSGARVATVHLDPNGEQLMPVSVFNITMSTSDRKQYERQNIIPSDAFRYIPDVPGNEEYIKQAQKVVRLFLDSEIGAKRERANVQRLERIQEDEHERLTGLRYGSKRRRR